MVKVSPEYLEQGFSNAYGRESSPEHMLNKQIKGLIQT